VCEDPAARGECVPKRHSQPRQPLTRGSRGRRGPVAGRLAHLQRHADRGDREAERQPDRQPKRVRLRESARQSAGGRRGIEGAGIVDKAACDHRRDGDEAAPLHQAFEHPRPLPRPADRLERVERERLVGPGDEGFGHAAQDPIGEERRQHPGRRHRYEAKHEHLRDHESRPGDEQPPAADEIGQGSGGHLQQHDRRRPHGIQDPELLDADTEVEKHDHEHGVIKPRVEQNPKGDEERDVSPQLWPQGLIVGRGHAAAEGEPETSGSPPQVAIPPGKNAVPATAVAKKRPLRFF